MYVSTINLLSLHIWQQNLQLVFASMAAQFTACNCMYGSTINLFSLDVWQHN